MKKTDSELLSMTNEEREKWMQKLMEESGAITNDKEEITKMHFLAGYGGEDRMVTAIELRQELANQPISRFNIKSKIKALDELTQGIEPGELIIISGKTKQGKTLLCQTLTRNYLDQGEYSSWFSYEVPIRQFLTQVPVNVDFITPRILSKNAFEWISHRVIESKEKFKSRIVFIDHLHYLVDLVKMKNPSLELGQIVRQLKRFAIEKEIVIFLISHVRGVEDGQEVTEEHLRDSKLVAAEADSTWIVSRLKNEQDKFGNMARVSIRNHRRTGVMAESFKMIKIGKFLEEYDETDPNGQSKFNGWEDSRARAAGQD